VDGSRSRAKAFRVSDLYFKASGVKGQEFIVYI
jgi:hypothetical protein